MLIQLASQNATQCSAFDRALQFGDAHFTTMKLADGQIELLSYHLDRLQKAHQQLKFPEIDWQSLESELLSAVELYKDATLKLLISRGESQRGYGFTKDITANVVLYINQPAVVPETPVELVFLQTKLAHQPLLAGIKHCNRLEQVLAKQELLDLPQEDGIVLDVVDNIIEVTSANVFVYMEGTWYTPLIEQCGIDGVMRNYVLDQMAEQDIECKVREISMREIKQIDAAFICNALTGIRAVSKLGALTLSTKPVESLANKIGHLQPA